VARIAVLCPDLLFGSRLQGGLEVAGHTVWRLDTPEQARGAAPESDALVVDLTSEDLDGSAVLESLREEGATEGVGTIGFYAHVDQETRQRAIEAGFDRVVPRSRMAREAARLVEGLVAERAG
jgi:DNA-binding response OmpR family regulator